MAHPHRQPPATDLQALLEEGDRAWANGDRQGAHELFRAAQQIDGNDPRVLSRLGMTLTIVARDEYKGVAFCEEALRRGCDDADSLWRLAMVYQATFQRERAVRAVRRGLQVDGDHPGLIDLIVALGVRRPPVLSFLKRSHPLNKYLGMLRHRLRSEKDEG